MSNSVDLREFNDALNQMKYDKIFIYMIRRNAPQLIANDIVGVQPMTNPTGMIYSMKTKYEGGNDENESDS